MGEFIQPAVTAVVIWWASTGLILWLVRRGRHTFGWTALGASFALGCASVALVALRGDTSVAAAYGGFAAGVILWGWHEVMFLLGFISGPRKSECPPGLPLMRRFVVSAETIIHHELGIALHALIIAVLSWGAANQIAAWTFFLLWGMRLSAKLVVFFGAPNVADHFLPVHLAYLKSYFNKGPVAAFLPAALTATVTVAAVLSYLALNAPHGSHPSIGYTLLAVLAGLAVLEHLALSVPLPDGALWAWAVRSDKPCGSGASSQWRKT